MKTTSTDSTVTVTNDMDLDYEDLSKRIQLSYAVASEGKLFTTDATGLWEAYLNCYPEDQRHTYVCNTCKKFIETYGGIVTVNSKGKTSSALFADVGGIEVGAGIRKVLRELPHP